ncbi:MAG: hypothetical protein V5A22_01630 [Salinivenus sp.]
MFLRDATRVPLRLVVLLIAPALLFGCSEAPEDIQTAGGSTVQWAPPDTVAVLVPGEPAGGNARWESPDSAQAAWLAEHGFERVGTRLSDAKTQELWLERLRTLRGLIDHEHIPEAREAVVRELAIEAVGSDEHLGLELSENFDADRFQERLEQRLGLKGATREEVQAKIDTFEAALEDYRERRVFGHVYYARSD